MHQRDIINKIREIFQQPTGFIPLHAPVFTGNEKKYLNECIDSTFVSSVGKFVDLFEETTAVYCGSEKAVACVNGTNALHLALLLVGVEPDTEVITQPLTFIATANAISYCRAIPVFVDVDLETMGLSPQSLLHFFEKHTQQVPDPVSGTMKCVNKNTGKQISACLPVHTFGHPCRIDEIVEICNANRVPVVEDAAESIGSFYKNKHTGTYADIGVLSFNGNKTITTGGGGMLLFRNAETANRAKHLTTQAKLPHPWEFVHDEIAYNYRMPNLNAALGLAQIEKIDSYIESKRKLAAQYFEFFCETEIKFLIEPQHAKSNYWLNCVLFPDKESRDRFLDYSNNAGVMTRPAWQLMYKLKMYKHCEVHDVKNALYIADRLVNLPSSVI